MNEFFHWLGIDLLALSPSRNHSGRATSLLRHLCGLPQKEPQVFQIVSQSNLALVAYV